MCSGHFQLYITKGNIVLHTNPWKSQNGIFFLQFRAVEYLIKSFVQKHNNKPFRQ